MSATSIAIYRLPIPKAAAIGHVRIVIDRNRRGYINESRIVGAAQSGDFIILTLANDESFYVKSGDFAKLNLTV